MKPVEFIGQTFILQPPERYDNGTAMAKVGGLPVMFVRNADGMPSLVSCWKPTPEEIAQLADGAVVCLSVFGGRMPPVAVYVAEAEILP